MDPQIAECRYENPALKVYLKRLALFYCNFTAGWILHTMLGGPVFTKRPLLSSVKAHVLLHSIYTAYTYHLHSDQVRM